MMKRTSDSTFELNLAPMLDIIVTVIPMLLLSVAFVQVKMIETPVPQVVAQAPSKQPTPLLLNLSLKMDKQFGYAFVVTDKGQTKEFKVALKDGHFDLPALTSVANQIKQAHPDHFRVELAPGETVSMNDIVKTIDAIRRSSSAKFSLRDEKSGRDVQTDLMFPDVVFNNVVAE